MEREEEDRAERESQQTLNKSNSPGTPSSNTSGHNCNESATIKLGVFSLDENNKKRKEVENSLMADNFHVMSKVSELVDLFVSDVVEDEDTEESVEVDYLRVEALDEVGGQDSPRLGDHETIEVESVEYRVERLDEVVARRVRPAADLRAVTLENSKLLILNNSLIYTANDGETCEMAAKEFESKWKERFLSNLITRLQFLRTMLNESGKFF